MLSRPGMELTGVVEYFRDSAKRRVQIIGTKEWLYLQSLESEVRRERARVLFTDETPVIVFSKNFEIPQEMIELSEQTEFLYYEVRRKQQYYSQLSQTI